MTPVAQTADQTPLRCAIVGAGVIGNIHARLVSSLADRASLVAVVDPNTSRAAAIAEKYGARPYPDAASAYAAEEIDSIAVCVPSGLHAQIAIEAMQAGKDVLIEKPIATTVADADRIIETERSTGRTVAVVSQRRFQPPVAFIKRAVSEGKLGRITTGFAESVLFRSQAYYDSDDWRGTIALDGGGALINQGIHALDLLLWMMGKPVRVSARTRLLAHERIEVEDVAAAMIDFESGAIGVVLASTAADPGLPVRVSVQGDQGVAVLEGDELRSFAAASAGSDIDQTIAQLNSIAEPDWNAVDLAHRAQYEDFIDAVRAGRPPMISTTDGRLSLAVILAIYESARTGLPVELGGITG
jgi:UDP-N-acetyl-2-amino-2-deoxyglucuronate dehydrogenase